MSKRVVGVVLGVVGLRRVCWGVGAAFGWGCSRRRFVAGVCWCVGAVSGWGLVGGWEGELVAVVADFEVGEAYEVDGGGSVGEP